MLKLNAYQLKWIAIVAMFLQHMFIALSSIFPEWVRFPLYAVGGFTYPIMAYFVVEGYRYTSNLKRYILRLFIFGLIALPFHIIALGIPLGGGDPYYYPWINIMFSIILSLIVLVIYDKVKIRALFWLFYVVVIVPISFLFFEWYFIGTTMVLLYHIIPNENARRIVPPIVTAVLWIAFAWAIGLEGFMNFEDDIFIARADFQLLMIAFGIVCGLASILVLGYNGERGKKMKWLFYIFYPLHLFALAAIGLALGLIDLSLIGF